MLTDNLLLHSISSFTQISEDKHINYYIHATLFTVCKGALLCHVSKVERIFFSRKLDSVGSCVAYLLAGDNDKQYHQPMDG